MRRLNAPLAGRAHPPGVPRDVVRGQSEVLLREGHLVTLAADGDQREALLRRPRAHHLGHVLVVRGQLHLVTREIIVVAVVGKG